MLEGLILGTLIGAYITIWRYELAADRAYRAQLSKSLTAGASHANKTRHQKNRTIAELRKENLHYKLKNFLSPKPPAVILQFRSKHVNKQREVLGPVQNSETPGRQHIDQTPATSETKKDSSE